MKNVAVAIFAHPDDEAFGPGGTLALLSKTHDVYIITVTDGQSGKCSISNPQEELSKIRKEELLTSAGILGIKKVYFLGYKDGTLSNSLYHEIASKIQRELEILKPTTVITFELRGVSGHLDHIAVSFITTYVIKKIKSIKELLYYCITGSQSKPNEDTYFIHFPKGYDPSATDRFYDITSVWDTKKEAIMAHKSQIHDAKRIIKTLSSIPKREHFLVHHNN